MVRTRLAALALASALGVVPAARAADSPASVLVRTSAPTRTHLTEMLTAYGVVAPESDRVSSVSFPNAGLVLALRVSLGQVVRRGEPLLDLQTDPAANLGYRQAASDVAYARGELARVQALTDQQLANRSQVAAAQKALDDAEARLAEQKRLGTESGNVTFRAPFDGVVAALSVSQGERIAAGTSALQLARTDRLRAQLGVEPEDAPRIKPGMPVRLVSVFDDRNPVDGAVARVQGVINPQTQLVDVVASFANADRFALLPGTRVRGEIAVGGSTSWAVPRQAVLRDAHGAYLFQVRDGRARRVDVATGIERDGLVAVSGAIDAGEQVVVLGNYELQDGMPVREAQP
jgi:membrane fusion protein, multidrug efflux system